MPSESAECVNSTFLPCAAAADPDQPILKFLMEPINKIRFRYKSEQGSHGGLTGATGSKKSCPVIKLENYNEKKTITIKVSLYMEDMENEHILELKGKNCHNGVCSVKLGKDMTAKFPSLGIVNKTKSEIVNTLFARKVKSLNASERRRFEKELKIEVQKEAKSINMNSARLCFEAYYESNPTQLLCQRLFSEPIYNQKSTLSGDLKIHRLSKSSGSCEGGEEVILLCDKVNKEDIEIHFYEKDGDYIHWADSGKFSKADVHFQYAITFRTPPYNGKNVETKVYIELVRPSDNAHSEPRVFTYYPTDYDVEGISKKRKKPNPLFEMVDVSLQPLSTFQTAESSSGILSSGNSNESTENFSLVEGNPCCSWPFEFMNEHKSLDTAETLNEVLSDFDLPGCPSQFYTDLLPPSADVPLDDNLYPVLDVFDITCYDEPYDSIEPAKLDVDGNIAVRKMHSVVKRHPRGIAEPQMMGLQMKNPIALNSNGSNDAVKQHLHEMFCGDMDNLFELPSIAKIAKANATVEQHPHGIAKTEKLPGEMNNSVELGSNVRLAVGEMCSGMSELTLDSKDNDINSKHHQEKREIKEINLDKNVSKIERLRSIIESIALYNDLKPLLHLTQHLICVPNKEGNTLLHLAVLHQSQNLVLIQKILEVTSKNAVNLQNKFKETALHIAVHHNEYNVLKLLLDYEGNPCIKNREGNNGFHIAVKHNYVQCLRVLTCMLKGKKSVPDLDSLNFQGLSALHIAVINNSKECMDLLVEAGANLNIKEGKCGRTPLHFAVDLQPSLISFLLAQPAIEVNAQDFGGTTALHLACIKDSVDVVKLLVQAGANPSLKNAQQCIDDEYEVTNGCTSIDFANDSTEIKKILELSLSEPEVSRCMKSNSLTLNEGRSNKGDKADSLDYNYFKNQLTFLNENTVEKLCNHMDPPSTRWKMLGTYLGMEPKECEKILELDPSPTRALIRFHERNYGDSSLERFKCILEMAGFNGALEIIQDVVT